MTTSHISLFRKGALSCALLIFVSAAPTAISAQQADTHTLSVRPTGRVLIDAAAYASPQKSLFPDGMCIPEARLGASFSYDNWKASIDVGFAYAKIGLRNMWVEYDFDKSNFLRVGNFIHQFGLQSVTRSKNNQMFEQPVASALFTPGLQMGVMYQHSSQSLFAAASAHVESAARTEVMHLPEFIQQGYGLLTRTAWRKTEDSDIIQAGLSLGFSTPQRTLKDGEDIHNAFSISAEFPTKVVKETAMSATVTEAKNLFKLSPEILMARGRAAFEAQYFFQNISRRNNLQAFRSQGAYGTVRGILKGAPYSYSSTGAVLADPAPGSLECVVNYNYSTLSDFKAGIFGGRCNSASLTLNYYFNPYITARLNYTYTHVWNRASIPAATMNAIQARIMVLF